jgi:tetraacyldisaccharide 4'-kinase
MRAALQRAWIHGGVLAWLLAPLSLVFWLLVAIRRALYRAGVLGSTRIPVPIVVVGNVVAGGAGKTPVVLAVVEHLKARGLRVGVVSRGYGRQTRDCREVFPDSAALEVGDEPLLLKRHSDVPVFVALARPQAAQALLAAYPDTQVIVSDDGLQHYALQRDIEICVFDERGTGNGFLMPAGPLREAWPRKVDLVLCHGAPPGIEGYAMHRRLAEWAQRADGTRIELAALRGERLKAIAGTASPGMFFRMLRERAINFVEWDALPDHYAFNDPRPADERDFTLLCTEKDAAKLWRQRPDAWAVPLQVRIDAGFFRAFDRLLDAKLLSSRHGSETA